MKKIFISILLVVFIHCSRFDKIDVVWPQYFNGNTSIDKYENAAYYWRSILDYDSSCATGDTVTVDDKKGIVTGFWSKRKY